MDEKYILKKNVFAVVLFFIDTKKYLKKSLWYYEGRDPQGILEGAI